MIFLAICTILCIIFWDKVKIGFKKIYDLVKLWYDDTFDHYQRKATNRELSDLKSEMRKYLIQELIKRWTEIEKSVTERIVSMEAGQKTYLKTLVEDDKKKLIKNFQKIKELPETTELDIKIMDFLEKVWDYKPAKKKSVKKR